MIGVILIPTMNCVIYERVDLFHNLLFFVIDIQLIWLDNFWWILGLSFLRQQILYSVQSAAKLQNKFVQVVNSDENCEGLKNLVLG